MKREESMKKLSPMFLVHRAYGTQNQKQYIVVEDIGSFSGFFHSTNLEISYAIMLRFQNC